MRECYSKALGYWSVKNYPEAIREYIKNLLLATPNERMQKFEKEFCILLNEARDENVHFKDKHRRISNEIFPDSPKVIRHLGVLLLNTVGDFQEAMYLLTKAYNLATGLEKVYAIHALNNARTSVVSTWHIKMINDRIRNEAFERALSRIIQSHSNVIDIGAGTSLLSMVTSRYTDTVIVSLEGQPSTTILACQSLIANNLGSRVLIQCQMSSQFLPDEQFPPDVIVSETMDAGAFGEKIIQIFHDVHRRWIPKPGHELILCPAKIAINIKMIQSDKFWKTRNHIHNCEGSRECQLRHPSHEVHQPLLISYHWIPSEENDRPNDYSTITLDDYDDIIELSDWYTVYSIDLNDRQVLDELHVMERHIIPLKLTAKTSGRVDAIIVSFTATLSEGVELESVHEGGWEHAVFPMFERKQLEEGQSWNGLFDMHYSEGIFIREIMNDIKDDNSIDLPIVWSDGPYRVIRREEDGYIEYANCDEFVKFIGCNRMNDWILKGCQDGYWPLDPSGILNERHLHRLELFRKYNHNPSLDTVKNLQCYACLFSSDRIDNAARPNPSSHLGFDLSPVNQYSLLEYRELRRVFDTNNPYITIKSDPFLLVEMDLTELKEYYHHKSYPTMTKEGDCDGVVYWWIVNGEFSTKEANLPMAALLFNERRSFPMNTQIPLRSFVIQSDLILFEGNNLISIETDATDLP